MTVILAGRARSRKGELDARVRIEPIRADITTLRVDAIVNAANSSLLGGGGVDGPAVAFASPTSQPSSSRHSARRPGARGAVDRAHDLPATWVIHTVGPVWHDGRRGEPGLLASCYRRSLEVADELGAASVAFPAISTGVYGYPKQAAAEVAVAAVRGTPTSVERVLLVAHDPVTLDLYERLLAG